MTENQITSLVATSENEHIVSINEKDIYSFTREYIEKGENKQVTVTITNQYAVARLSNIDAIINLNKKSNIALAIELARLKKAIAEENGFKTVAQMVHSIHDDLSETTINSYRRVGVVFGDLSNETFRWKSAIPQNTSITNLVQAVGLVEVNKDTDKITQEEAEKAVQNFYNDYIMSDRLHLLLPLAKLKEEIKSIQNTIDITATETGTDSKQTDSKQTDSKQTDSKQTDCKQTDSKQTDSKQTDCKQTDSKEEVREYLTDDIKRIQMTLLEISDNCLKAPKYSEYRKAITEIIEMLDNGKFSAELSDNEPS